MLEKWYRNAASYFSLKKYGSDRLPFLRKQEGVYLLGSVKFHVLLIKSFRPVALDQAKQNSQVCKIIKHLPGTLQWTREMPTHPKPSMKECLLIARSTYLCCQSGVNYRHLSQGGKLTQAYCALLFPTPTSPLQPLQLLPGQREALPSMWVSNSTQTLELHLLEYDQRRPLLDWSPQAGCHLSPDYCAPRTRRPCSRYTNQNSRAIRNKYL